ncbi:MAG: DUF5117 domain-containing protein, partial [Pseudomonadota bacterium]
MGNSLSNSTVARMVALLGVLLLSLPVRAADDKDDKEKDKDKEKTVAELTEKHTVAEGLVTLFQDEKSGELKLSLPTALLDAELIYFAQATDGVVQTGYFRGAYLANNVISFQRRFNRIDIVKHNTSYYFDPDNALARASAANISNAIVASEKILAEDEGQVLINADKLFTTEALLQVKPSPNPDGNPRAFKLGSLSADKSRVLNLRSYPKNTDVEVELVYSNSAPTGRTGADITDDRHVAVRIVHSIIAMP